MPIPLKSYGVRTNNVIVRMCYCEYSVGEQFFPSCPFPTCLGGPETVAPKEPSQMEPTY